MKRILDILNVLKTISCLKLFFICALMLTIASIQFGYWQKEFSDEPIRKEKIARLGHIADTSQYRKYTQSNTSLNMFMKELVWFKLARQENSKVANDILKDLLDTVIQSKNRKTIENIEKNQNQIYLIVKNAIKNKKQILQVYLPPNICIYYHIDYCFEVVQLIKTEKKKLKNIKKFRIDYLENNTKNLKSSNKCNRFYQKLLQFNLDPHFFRDEIQPDIPLISKARLKVTGAQTLFLDVEIWFSETDVKWHTNAGNPFDNTVNADSLTWEVSIY